MAAKKYFFIVLTIIDLSLSIAHAQSSKKEASIDDLDQDSVTGALTLESLSNGENFNDPKFFSPEPGTEEVIIPEESLPKVRTQDGTPLCQTFCPTLLTEFHYCKQKGIKNCKALPDSERISPISTLMYRDNVDNKIKASIGSIGNSGNRKSYEVLNSISSSSFQTFFSEACAPFDEVTKNFKNNAQAFESYRSELELKFRQIKAKLKETEATVSSCPECLELLNSINTKFNSKSTFAGIKNALEVDEFNRFLFRILFTQQTGVNENCKELTLPKRVRAKYFPTSTEPFSTVDQVFDQAAVQLKNNNPVILSSICFARKKANEDCSSHCLVMTGKKTVRDKNTNEVIELVKVQNSWGDEWQDSHSGGWVRADRLKSQVRTFDDQNAKKLSKDRKDAFRFTISWFQ